MPRANVPENWIVEKNSDVCVTISIPFDKRADWEQWVLMTADRHIDNIHSNIEMQKRHLDLAKQRNAIVIDAGDLFDAMQGKSDRRSSKSSIRPENVRSDYINSLQELAYDILSPYSKQIAVLFEGNHETGILKHLEYNMHSALCRDLRRDGSQVVHMGYRGYVRFRFVSRVSNNSFMLTAYVLHGSGGGGPVTKGVIQTNRRAVYLPDANIVFSGHIHEAWVLPVMRSRLLSTGQERIDKQYHIQIPTYKDEFTGLSGGYHHENGRPPKPIGAWWLRFFHEYVAPGHGHIQFDITEAR